MSKRSNSTRKLIKAAICKDFNAPLEIETVSIAAPLEDEIEVRIEACAICHSDLAYMDGIWGGNLPSICGHEAAGRILSLGSEVTGFEVGDCVAVTLIRSCGACPSCKRGHPANCEDGYDRMAHSPLKSRSGHLIEQGLATAGFAEIAVVHHSQVAKLPQSMPMNEASLLACGVITGFGAAINAAEVFEGAVVAVIGVGGVGLNTIQGCTYSGADQIIAIDVEAAKLSAAKEFGATHGLLVGANLIDEVKAITHGRGVDFVFVTVGEIKAFSGGMEMLAPRGELVIVGMPPIGATLPFEPGNLAAYSQIFRGSKMGDAIVSRDIPKLAKLYLEKRLLLTELISETFPFDRINEAIEVARASQSRRVVLTFDTEGSKT